MGYRRHDYYGFTEVTGITLGPLHRLMRPTLIAHPFFVGWIILTYADVQDGYDLFAIFVERCGLYTLFSSQAT